MYYDSYYGAESTAFLGFLFVLMGIALLVSLVFYLMFAFGLKKLAEREGIEHAWFAFIPLLQLYLMGEIAQDKVSVQGLPQWLLWGAIGNVLLSWIPVINILVMFVYYILIVVTLYYIFDKYSKNALIFTIFSFLFGLYPIFIYIIRNNPKQEGSTLVG